MAIHFNHTNAGFLVPEDSHLVTESTGPSDEIRMRSDKLPTEKGASHICLDEDYF